MISLTDKLRLAGLRPTAQRMVLAEHLFRGSHKHTTAEKLHEAMSAKGEQVALATVYNTLRQFTDAGLLRQIVVGSGKSYFDTNVSAHHHFYHESNGELEDIPLERISVTLDGLNPLEANSPAGTKIADVDVVVRLRQTH